MAVRSFLRPEQDEALRRLTDRGVLTGEQLDAVRGALLLAEPVHEPLRGKLAEIGGYLGGGLILGGAALLVGTSWRHLSHLAQVGLLATVCLGLLAAATATAGGPGALGRAAEHQPPVRRRLAGVLFALAAVAGALTAATAATDDQGSWAGVTGLAVAVAGYAAQRTVAGVATTALFSMIATGSVLGEAMRARPVAVGVGFVLVGLIWGLCTAAGLVTPRWAGFATAVVFALFGAQQPLAESDTQVWAYALTAAVAAGCFAAYATQRSPVLLVGGVLGTTIAAPEAIWDWTGGAAGGALVVLTAGVVLLVASLLALRLRH